LSIVFFCLHKVKWNILITPVKHPAQDVQKVNHRKIFTGTWCQNTDTIPFYPCSFPTIITPKKNLLNTDSIEEIIPAGALKMERK